jgi:hypothetical protein
MSRRAAPHRGACPCGSGQPIAACCQPREEDFQRVVARLLAFAEAPEVRRDAEEAAELYWTPQSTGSWRTRPDAALRFLEWILHDYAPEGSRGPRLAEFADQAGDLPTPEQQLLLTLLLSPVRAYLVADSPGVRGVSLEDLLTGEERLLVPFGVGSSLIRADILVCRTIPFGHAARAGMGIIRLPGGCREELFAYLRMAYQVSRPPRHVALADFLDGGPHLYHHFFLDHGVRAGAEAWATVRGYAYRPGGARYRVENGLRLRAALSRQPDLEREGPGEGDETYRWRDPRWGVTRARFVLGGAALTVWAETGEDLAAATEFVGRILQGLASPSPPALSIDASPKRPGGPATERRGRAFLRRAVAAWPDFALPVLGGRSVRQAALLPGLRRAAAALLAGLEGDLARQKRLGRAWVDVSPLWDALGIADLAPAHARRQPARDVAPRARGGPRERRATGSPRRARRSP